MNIPSNANEIMFTIQRYSNGRTIACTIVPYGQFVGGAVYAFGSFTMFADNIGNLPNVVIINAVCIDAGNNQVEIAVGALNEVLRFRLFYR